MSSSRLPPFLGHLRLRPIGLALRRAAQQFCGHAETSFPSGSVMVRRSPARDRSLARLASAVTVLFSAASISVLLVSRARKKLGDGPSSDQVCVSLAFLVSTINSIWGFLQSIFVRVPLIVIRSLKS